jgi:hypothetical protein
MTTSKSSKTTDKATDQLMIRGKLVTVKLCKLKQADLSFFIDNPRIYSVVHDDGKHPSQEEVEEFLKQQDHVRELKESIKANDGLLEHLFVKEGTLEVVEGNRRLAAYRILFAEDPIKWNEVKCALLPPDLDESFMNSLLGEIHLKGKKPWSPYEKASFLHRRFRKDGVTVDDLKKEFNISKQAITHSIDVIDLMEKHEEEDTRRWSYYDEFLKSRKAGSICENVASFEDVIVEKIKLDEVGTAMEFRGNLRVICQSTSKKPIKDLVSGKCSFEDSVGEAEKSGGDNRPLQRIKKFRGWLGEASTKTAVKHSAEKIQGELAYELRKIKTVVEKLLKII